MIERWNGLSLRAKRWWTVVGVAAAVLVLMTSLNALGSAPGGPSLSANSTGADGLAAWEELLDRSGHATQELRADLARAALTPDTTVIAIGQVFTRAERAAVREFVDAGGTLVVGEIEGEATLRSFGDRGAVWDAEGSERFRLPDSSLAVVGEGLGSWRGSSGVPVLTERGRVGAVQLSYGQGSVVALADPSPVTNAWLDRGANALFATDIVGEGRAVAFAEHGHGYGTTTGYGALPARWKAAFWFAGIAAVVGAWSAGKRLGPADPVVEAPPPERVRYVHAVASTLARTRERDAAVEPLRARARDLLARGTAGRELDDTDALAAAAHAAGLSNEDIAALTAAVHDDAALVALARSVSHLEEH